MPKLSDYIFRNPSFFVQRYGRALRPDKSKVAIIPYTTNDWTKLFQDVFDARIAYNAKRLSKMIKVTKYEEESLRILFNEVLEGEECTYNHIMYTKLPPTTIKGTTFNAITGSDKLIRIEGERMYVHVHVTRRIEYGYSNLAFDDVFEDDGIVYRKGQHGPICMNEMGRVEVSTNSLYKVLAFEWNNALPVTDGSSQ